MPGDVVAMSLQNLNINSDAVFLPFKPLCKTIEMDTLVLADDHPSTALLNYLSKSGISNLVLGSSSINCIARKLKGPSVSSTILKLAPDNCNIYVVSRKKLRTKLADLSSEEGSNSPPEKHHLVQLQHRMRIRKISQTKTDSLDKRMPLLSDYLEPNEEHNVQASQLGLYNEHTAQASQTTGSDASSPQLLRDDSSCTVEKPQENFLLSPSREEHLDNSDSTIENVTEKSQICNKQDGVLALRDSFCILNSTKQHEAPEEVERLRAELKNTLAMYNQACRDLIYARNKVQLLYAECSDDAKKVKDAMEREQILKKIVEEEKAKHLEAIKEVEEARRLLEKEVNERQRAEMISLKELSERKKIVEELLSSNQRYRRYTSAEIEAATDSFSDAQKIGEGGYGKVYKCNLHHTPVAIKVLRQETADKKEEFFKEVEVLSQLRHPHMVSLLGACPENGSLVYEYMENGSLEDQIFRCGGTPPLPWYVRLRIIFQVACGLAFLHGSKPEPIVHRDLKPGNILLDKHFVSKIGDVGLAKLMSDVVSDSVTEYRDTIIAGTLHFVDPEYLRTGTVRPKSDIYAFGIIILQLLTGKHPRGLLTAVERAIGSGSFEEILDSSITDWPLAESETLAELALKCAALRCRDRPDLESEIMPVLEELLYIADVHCKLEQSNIDAPSHFFCPILQEVMDDPYIAADGFTYEHRAIEAWLEKHSISPVTELPFPHNHLTPNHSLRSAIQEWKAHSSFSTIP